ncbi:hypothetical protein D3C87_1469030 [compost metagenome]
MPGTALVLDALHDLSVLADDVMGADLAPGVEEVVGDVPRRPDPGAFGVVDDQAVDGHAERTLVLVGGR